MSVQSAVDICNLAQDLLGAEALGSIEAPRSANEKRYARQFPIVFDAELRKRRWNFSKAYASITPTGDPIVTDRNLRLTGAPNTRDLGGYGTYDGKRVRWGRLFRSDGLGNLTDGAIAHGGSTPFD